MANRAFAVDKNPLIAGLNDFPNVLVSRLTPDKPLLQDIACLALRRPAVTISDARSAVDEAVEMVKLLDTLGGKALASKSYNASYFLDAIYEIAALGFADWPEALDIASPIDPTVRRKDISPREVIERAIMQALQNALKQFHGAKDVFSSEWKHSAFSLLALAMATNKRSPRAGLETHIRATVNLWETLVRQDVSSGERRAHEEDFEYLQLVGAWCIQYLADVETSARIGKFVAEFKPFSTAISGGHDRYDHYGYPSLHFSDFSLKHPNNPHLSQRGWQLLQAIAQEVMTHDVLMSYFHEVEKTRGPLEKQFYERVRAAEKRGRSATE
jgi:hypothetical protein